MIPGDGSVEIGAKEIKSRRHHANDGARLIVDHQCGTDDRCILVKFGLPVPVTEHDHWIGSGQCVAFGEPASEQRWNPVKTHGVWSEYASVDGFVNALVEKENIPTGDSDDVFEGVAFPLERDDFVEMESAA